MRDKPLINAPSEPWPPQTAIISSSETRVSRQHILRLRPDNKRSYFVYSFGGGGRRLSIGRDGGGGGGGGGGGLLGDRLDDNEAWRLLLV